MYDLEAPFVIAGFGFGAMIGVILVVIMSLFLSLGIFGTIGVILGSGALVALIVALFFV